MIRFWLRRGGAAHGSIFRRFCLGLLGFFCWHSATFGAFSQTVFAAPRAQSSSDPLVFAFYYTWFDENTWSYDRLSDLPAQSYVSSDRGVMGRHIDQAKAAGIDALIVAWYGPNGNQTEPNLAALLEEAAARNFKIGILFETDSPFLGGTDAITGALRHALGVHANHPAFLRVDGRPVLFFWRPTIYGVESWRAIRNQADPGYGSIWIAEGVNPAYMAVFDGHHLYSNTWNPPADLSATNQKFARWVNQARQDYGAYKYWVATVMPGYNDVRIRPGSGFAKDREGGAYYERSWQAALGSQPNWIVITSFNEWPEGSYIEPSAAFGDTYLQLTARWSQQFRAGGPSQAAQVAAPPPAALAPETPPTPTPTPLPEPESPTAYVQVALLNLRGGPSTDFALIGRATEGAALAITGYDPAYPGWWQVRATTDQGEQDAWIFGDLVRAAGPLATVPVVAVPLFAAPTPPAPPTVADASMTNLSPATVISNTIAPTVVPEAPTYKPRLSQQ
ncbi:MAG: SH3 domain-containing protein [Caldilineaceae bacterium]|nr:SH3 domain-containing protein [Caldilineaceae bacterium]